MTQPAPKESRLVRSVAIVFVASFAVLPMVLFGCSPEWARWDASQANAFFKQGETSDALYQLRDAIGKSPRDPVIKLTLAQRLIELEEPQESLVLCAEVLEAYPDNMHAMQVKSYAQQRIGDFEAALKTEMEIEDWLRVYRGDSRLNEMAYARGLANKDLPLAKAGIETAIAKYNRAVGWRGDKELPIDFRIKATVLASLVSRSCEMQDESLQVLSRQVVFYRKKVDTLRGDLAEIVYQQAGIAFPVREGFSGRDQRRELRVAEIQLATLLSCRALLLQDLGERERCRSDRLEVQTIGYQSSQVVAAFPDDKAAILSLDGLAAVLDTRGFICGMLPWRDDLSEIVGERRYFVSSHSDAIWDMDVALLSNRISQASFDCSLRNVVELSFDHDGSLDRLRKQEAVLRYHRMLVHQRHGDDELAAVDDQRIRELGEEPGPHLF